MMIDNKITHVVDIDANYICHLGSVEYINITIWLNNLRVMSYATDYVDIIDWKGGLLCHFKPKGLSKEVYYYTPECGGD